MKEKLLIVESDAETMSMLRMVISKYTTHDVLMTDNPYEAVELIKEGGIGTVITALKMPGLDGIDLLESARGIDEDLPVIILTHYGSIDSAIESMNKGGFYFITMPFRKEQVLFLIKKALEWRLLKKENRMLKERLDKIYSGAAA